MQTLTIDPGLQGTGWAYFRGEGMPADSGVIRPPKGDDLPHRANAALSSLKRELGQKNIGHVVLEMPGLWSGSAMSQAAAARGDLTSLAYLVGVLSTVRPRAIVRLVAPGEWKGQLPKDVVISRIRRAWKYNGDIRDHEADAWGIGLWLQQGKL